MRNATAILAVVVGLVAGGCGEPLAPVSLIVDAPDTTSSTTHPPSTTTTAEPTTTTTLAPPPAPPPPPTTTIPAQVVAAAAPAPPPASSDCGGWADTVAAHFPAEQVDKGCQVLVCESGGDPTAQNVRSSASGLFQILQMHAWRFESFGWSWADRYDGAKNTAVAAMIWRESGWGAWQCS